MTIRLGSVFHLKYPRMKHEENSLAGILEAERGGYDSIDLDMLPDASDRVCNDHWLEPMIHDQFVDPLGQTDPHTKITAMHPDVVDRLVAHGRFHIRPMHVRLTQARRHGLKVRAEAKPGGHWTTDKFRQLLVPHAREFVVVATMDNYDGWEHTLEQAKALDFQTQRLRM